ncbi:hypothetical protein CupriaWKF_05725 [Cupriavidus sp. WKF15]|uniref:hypothetical protein n=1 Tax=Cupriavidus sp. WKF15 TaxID=3032282 RepID=UPI0023E1BA19|nr:hypothetical protein [Cupriavidus sp. WKF15]WER47063.1 hypothetical protein CupriaWKF_05725 [Cupriavidus sp. WKF15]
MTGRYFAVFATDKPDMATTRERVRPAHRAYLRAPGEHAVVARLGGPTLSPDGTRMTGTLLVVHSVVA